MTKEVFDCDCYDAMIIVYSKQYGAGLLCGFLFLFSVSFAIYCFEEARNTWANFFLASCLSVSAIIFFSYLLFLLF